MQFSLFFWNKLMHISSLSYFLFCTFYRLNLKEHNNTCTLAHRTGKMWAVQSYYLPIYEFIIKGFLFHSRWCITKPMCCSRRLHWCVDKRWCLVYYHPTIPSEFTLINVWQVFVCFSALSMQSFAFQTHFLDIVDQKEPQEKPVQYSHVPKPRFVCTACMPLF